MNTCGANECADTAIFTLHCHTLQFPHALIVASSSLDTDALKTLRDTAASVDFKALTNGDVCDISVIINAADMHEQTAIYCNVIRAVLGSIAPQVWLRPPGC